jgi:hypothetical protein
MPRAPLSVCPVEVPNGRAPRALPSVLRNGSSASVTRMRIPARVPSVPE